MTRALSACALVAALALAACNTIAGAGEDVKSAGQGVANGATATKNSINGN